MDILPGFKLCHKGLHKYPANKKKCPECRKNAQYKWNAKNPSCNKKSSKKKKMLQRITARGQVNLIVKEISDAGLAS